MTTREICKLCRQENPIGFSVPDHIWQQAIPEHARKGVVCLSCFARLADANLLPWDDDIKLWPVSLHTHLMLSQCPQENEA